MSLNQLLRLELMAGYVDAHTRPEQHPRLLKFGWFFTIAGAVSFAIAIAFEWWLFSAFAVLAALAGILALFGYALAAKNYGTLAAVFVMMFFGTCAGIIMVGRGQTQPPAELAAPQQVVKAAVPAMAAALPTDRQPKPSESKSSDATPGPTTTTEDTRFVPISSIPRGSFTTQVYVDQTTGLYYREECARPQRRMTKMPKAAATAQAFKPAPDCVTETAQPTSSQ